MSHFLWLLSPNTWLHIQPSFSRSALPFSVSHIFFFSSTFVQIFDSLHFIAAPAVKWFPFGVSYHSVGPLVPLVRICVLLAVFETVTQGVSLVLPFALAPL
ncbi:hypothetical protein GQ42DRAFT_163598, partial [Ramicandelaber brevisporus]